METVREKWTDERLDDLNHRVDEGFRESREELRAFRTESGEEMRALRSESREEMRALRVEMNGRFDSMDSRFDSMQRTMVQVAVAMTAAYLAGFAGLAALIATQL